MQCNVMQCNVIQCNAMFVCWNCMLMYPHTIFLRQCCNLAGRFATSYKIHRWLGSNPSSTCPSAQGLPPNGATNESLGMIRRLLRVSICWGNRPTTGDWWISQLWDFWVAIWIIFDRKTPPRSHWVCEANIFRFQRWCFLK